MIDTQAKLNSVQFLEAQLVIVLGAEDSKINLLKLIRNPDFKAYFTERGMRIEKATPQKLVLRQTVKSDTDLKSQDVYSFVEKTNKDMLDHNKLFVEDVRAAFFFELGVDSNKNTAFTDARKIENILSRSGFASVSSSLTEDGKLLVRVTGTDLPSSEYDLINELRTVKSTAEGVSESQEVDPSVKPHYRKLKKKKERDASAAEYAATAYPAYITTMKNALKDYAGHFRSVESDVAANHGSNLVENVHDPLKKSVDSLALAYWAKFRAERLRGAVQYERLQNVLESKEQKEKLTALMKEKLSCERKCLKARKAYEKALSINDPDVNQYRAEYEVEHEAYDKAVNDYATYIDQLEELPEVQGVDSQDLIFEKLKNKIKADDKENLSDTQVEELATKREELLKDSLYNYDYQGGDTFETIADTYFLPEDLHEVKMHMIDLFPTANTELSSVSQDDNTDQLTKDTIKQLIKEERGVSPSGAKVLPMPAKSFIWKRLADNWVQYNDDGSLKNAYDKQSLDELNAYMAKNFNFSSYSEKEFKDILKRFLKLPEEQQDVVNDIFGDDRYVSGELPLYFSVRLEDITDTQIYDDTFKKYKNWLNELNDTVKSFTGKNITAISDLKSAIPDKDRQKELKQEVKSKFGENLKTVIEHYADWEKYLADSEEDKKFELEEKEEEEPFDEKTQEFAKRIPLNVADSELVSLLERFPAGTDPKVLADNVSVQERKRGLRGKFHSAFAELQNYIRSVLPKEYGSVEDFLEHALTSNNAEFKRRAANLKKVNAIYKHLAKIYGYIFKQTTPDSTKYYLTGLSDATSKLIRDFIADKSAIDAKVKDLRNNPKWAEWIDSRLEILNKALDNLPEGELVGDKQKEKEYLLKMIAWYEAQQKQLTDTGDSSDIYNPYEAKKEEDVFNPIKNEMDEQTTKTDFGEQTKIEEK